jgi:hypothetical protein
MVEHDFVRTNADSLLHGLVMGLHKMKSFGLLYNTSRPSREVGRLHNMVTILPLFSRRSDSHNMLMNSSGWGSLSFMLPLL